MPDHIVNEGDCIDSIAADHGFFPDTLWNHGDNSSLKQKRKDPNVLLAGDKVVIPEKQLKEESKPQEKRHKFKRKGVPAKLRLRFLRPKPPKEEKDEADDAGGGAPSSSAAPSAGGIGSGGGGDPAADSSYEDLAIELKSPEMEAHKNTPYILEIDGKTTEGQTDGDGKIQISIPPHARQGKLTFNPGTDEASVIPLNLGGMDPADSITGARKRLNNAGYVCAPDGADMTPDLKEALMRFQLDVGLEAKGEFNKATQDKLKDVHGC